MNKKLIIAIVAGVVALALIVTAAVVIIKKVNINEPDNGDNSSLTSSVASDNDNSTPSNGTDEVTVDKGSVSIGTAEAKTGDVIDVPIKLSDNPGILAGKFVFEYDANALDYVDYEKGNLFEEYEINPTAGKISCIIMAAGLDDVTDNGTVITLQFKVKDGAAKGDYAIKFSSESEIANSNEQMVNPKISDGKITVK